MKELELVGANFVIVELYVSQTSTFLNDRKRLYKRHTQIKRKIVSHKGKHFTLCNMNPHSLINRFKKCKPFLCCNTSRLLHRNCFSVCQLHNLVHTVNQSKL